MKVLATVVGLLLLVACSSPKVSFEEISSELEAMGYEKEVVDEQQAQSLIRWNHTSSSSRQETPRVHTAEGEDGWTVGFIDFDVFYCLPTEYLSPREAIERSKAIFAQIPAKDRVAVPTNPDRAEIKENGLLCHVGRGG